MKFLKTTLFASALIFSYVTSAAGKIYEGYYVHDKNFLQQVSNDPDLVVDHVTMDGFELWGPNGLGAWLKRVNVPVDKLNAVVSRSRQGYLSPEEIGKELQAIAAAHPQLAKLFSVGKSSLGRDLWVMKISKNVSVDDQRPEFKYIANMHGDEIVGRELMVELIKDLLDNYGKDSQITSLVDHTQIYIMPSMNPDGAAAGTRYSGENIDLNRNFPDWTTSDNQNVPEGRGVETQAVMKWQKTRHFVLSANFHGGAEVVNYPWDALEEVHPLDALVKSLSLSYAKLVPYIFRSTAFENGMTNGWAWYQVNGGMQDWSWYYHRDLQLTIELSNQKWPNYSTVSGYYKSNRPALLDFISQAQKMNQNLQ